MALVATGALEFGTIGRELGIVIENGCHREVLDDRKMGPTRVRGGLLHQQVNASHRVRKRRNVIEHGFSDHVLLSADQSHIRHWHRFPAIKQSPRLQHVRLHLGLRQPVSTGARMRR